MNTKIHYWTGDVERMLSFYLENLGFDLLYRQPKEGEADFCILQMNASQIMFAAFPVFDITGRTDRTLLEKVSERKGLPGPLSVYIGVDDIDAHYGYVSRKEAEIIEPLWDTPWGLRQFSILDPDKNIITFYKE